MAKKKKTGTSENPLFNLDDILAELSKQPEIESISADELDKLTDGLKNIPIPDISDITISAQDLDSLLKDITAIDSEFSVDLSELDDFNIDGEKEASSCSEPNRTVKDVALWMLQEVTNKKILYQSKAARHIRRTYGPQFIYLNKNRNPAIAPAVLKDFLIISFSTVVWNKQRRLWRLRQNNDPRHRRSVVN